MHLPSSWVAPVILNTPNEFIVSVGSNISIPCSARGHPSMQFTWFQDEILQKNNASAVFRTNLTDLPASTKLLEERRYEISEENDLLLGNGVTTSTLFLYNLTTFDTSLFLCWVENTAGFAIGNFSVTVTNDTTPISSIGQQANTSGQQHYWNPFGLSSSDTQLGIITVGFVVLLTLVMLLLVMFKNIFISNRSSKNSHRPSSSSSSSASIDQIKPSSCQKVDPKLLSTGDLDGFIEHMRSGIINMDYHSMSPVIQFNNTLKKNNIATNSNSTIDVASGQPMHHFTSPSNTSSIPYFTSNSNGTTSSDLSPGSGYTTTTSYTSDYQSGYSEDQNIMTHGFYTNPRMGCDPSIQIPATMCNSGPIMMAPPVHHRVHQQRQHLDSPALMLQNMI